MRAVLAIAAKDIRSLSRDRAGAFFIFLFPVVFAILFGLIFSGQGGGPRGIGLAVLDEDGGAASSLFAERLVAGETFRLVELEAEGGGALTRERLYARVRGGEVAAAVVIPEGFSASLDGVLAGERAAIRVATDPGQPFVRGVIAGQATRAGFEVLSESFADPAQLQRLLDTSRRAVASADELGAGDRLLFDTFFGALDALVEGVGPDGAPTESETASGGETESGGEGAPEGELGEAEGEAEVGGGFALVPIEFEDVLRERTGPPNAFAITFPQAVAWGLLGCVIGFGISLVQERTRGTLARLVMAPVTRWHILGGKAVACFATALAVQAGILALGRFAFGVVPDSWPMLAVSVACACVGFVGLMMLLAVVGKTEAASEGFSRSVLLILALMGGAGVPLAVMPEWIRAAASVSPFKWVILSLEGPLWRGASPVEMLLPWGVLLALGVVGFTIGALLFRTQADS